MSDDGNEVEPSGDSAQHGGRTEPDLTRGHPRSNVTTSHVELLTGRHEPIVDLASTDDEEYSSDGLQAEEYPEVLLEVGDIMDVESYVDSDAVAEEDDYLDADEYSSDSPNDAGAAAHASPVQTVQPACSTSAENPAPMASGPSDKLVDEDDMTCTICYEQFNNSGKHRLVCLKCGHCFGRSCIEKWLTGRRKACPQCNEAARMKDIRPLYVRALKAVDTTEYDQIKEEVELERAKRREAEYKSEHCQLQIEELHGELTVLKVQVQSMRAVLDRREAAAPGNDARAAPILRHQHSSVLNAAGGCRVMAASGIIGLIAVSQAGATSIGFGVRKVGYMDLRPCELVPNIHQKPIRDMAFNPNMAGLLLSVGMDSRACLTNMESNSPVQSPLQCPSPLWSCCWSLRNNYEFYTGSQAGCIAVYDMRNLSSAVVTTPADENGYNRVPISSMACVKTTSGASGLVACSLNSVSYFPDESGASLQKHVLPLSGSFMSAAFNSKSDQILVSSRANQHSQFACHSVLKLVCDTDHKWSCITDRKFYGGESKTFLSRSRFLDSPIPNTELIGAGIESRNSVNIWDCVNGSCLQALPSGGSHAVDLCSIKSGQDAFVTILNDCGIGVFKWESPR